MWYWLVDAVADRDLTIIGILLVALFAVTALLGWVVLAH
jgi:hypothetical protein